MNSFESSGNTMKEITRGDRYGQLLSHDNSVVKGRLTQRRYVYSEWNSRMTFEMEMCKSHSGAHVCTTTTTTTVIFLLQLLLRVSYHEQNWYGWEGVWYDAVNNDIAEMSVIIITIIIINIMK